MHDFAVYMVYMARFVHWIAIDSLVSKRAFWFRTIHPRNHGRFYAVTIDATQTTATRYNGAHTAETHAYTRARAHVYNTSFNPVGIPVDSAESDSLKWKHGPSSSVLTYSFREKFRTGVSDKIETHRPPMSSGGIKRHYLPDEKFPRNRALRDENGHFV